MLLALIAALVFTAVLLLVLAFTDRAAQPGLAEQIASYSGHEAETVGPSSSLVGELDRGIVERLWGPALVRLGTLLQRASPNGTLEATRLKVDRAGSPEGLTALRFMGLRALVTAIGVIVAAAVLQGHYFPQPMNLMFALLVALFFCLVPDYWLQAKVNARERLIRRALPSTLDLLVACAEAGLGLDQAVSEVARRRPGPLSDELNRLLREIGLGKTRAEAWRDLSHRGGVEDLRNLAAAIYQSEQLGSSIGHVLRVQADAQRRRFALRVREEAAKLPVKMMFPLVFCIFPALFMVILGPALISILRTFVLKS